MQKVSKKYLWETVNHDSSLEINIVVIVRHANPIEV